MSPDELLQAAQALKADDLDRLVSQLLLIGAQRRAPLIPEAEAELLERINQGLPPELAAPYLELMTRRRAGLLTPAEQEQLLRLTHQVETIQASRVEDLVKLAQLRRITLEALARSLGLRPDA